jgi:hypothetical protein
MCQFAYVSAYPYPCPYPCSYAHDRCCEYRMCWCCDPKVSLHEIPIQSDRQRLALTRGPLWLPPRIANSGRGLPQKACCATTLPFPCGCWTSWSTQRTCSTWRSCAKPPTRQGMSCCSERCAGHMLLSVSHILSYRCSCKPSSKNSKLSGKFKGITFLFSEYSLNHALE